MIIDQALCPKRSLASQEPCLPSVDRAIDVLELLATCRTGLTLSDLSRRLKIPKSTAHYLIRTLMVRGYIQRETGGRHYFIGLRVSNLATATTPELQLRNLTLPYLRQLTSTFDLTATASVLCGAEAVIIAAAPSFRDVGGGAWIGRHMDVHCTAQGKALIAFLSETDLQKLLGNRELARFTRNTIASMPLLKSHLSKIRKDGFAVNDQEHVIGLRAVAAPIFDHLGSVVAAISVRGLLSEFQEWRFGQLGPKLALVAHEISRELGNSSDSFH
ncbi:MAG: IclR family transcriptional regulator [Acidobacteriaceae bacterium]|nr:IclR family transcriptional regulator [Acidobacteriaceae bacterium]MBV9306727.1 IclR family transcriptional regulator [Acidobacteriaceae bacterium]